MDRAPGSRAIISTIGVFSKMSRNTKAFSITTHNGYEAGDRETGKKFTAGQSVRSSPSVQLFSHTPQARGRSGDRQGALHRRARYRRTIFRAASIKSTSFSTRSRIRRAPRDFEHFIEIPAAFAEFIVAGVAQRKDRDS